MTLWKKKKKAPYYLWTRDRIRDDLPRGGDDIFIQTPRGRGRSAVRGPPEKGGYFCVE